MILTPVAPTTAYKFDAMKDPLKVYLGDLYTVGANLAGLPAISVPVNKDSFGLNISAQLLGRPFDEESVLNGALVIENLVKE